MIGRYALQACADWTVECILLFFFLDAWAEHPIPALEAGLKFRIQVGFKKKIMMSVLLWKGGWVIFLPVIFYVPS